MIGDPEVQLLAALAQGLKSEYQLLVCLGVSPFTAHA